MKIHPLSLIMVLGLIAVGYFRLFDSSAVATKTSQSTQFNLPQADIEAIRQTALDYIEGWYQGNVERMERSLHSDLVKRDIRNNNLHLMTKRDLVGNTQHSAIKGKLYEARVLDVYKNIGMVKVDSTDYMDYIQVGKINGKWVIINVLWAPK